MTGIKQGIEQGISQGQKNEKIEIARKLKQEKAGIDLIVKVTGLTKNEIEKL